MASPIIDAYLSGELTLEQAADLYDAEMRRQGISHKVPVKFSAEGTPYVDSTVGIMRPGKLMVMIEAARERMRQKGNE